MPHNYYKTKQKKAEVAEKLYILIRFEEFCAAFLK